MKGSNLSEQRMLEYFNPLVTVAAEILKYAENVVVLTGAGMSTKSGIADFRSPNGLWSDYDPTKYVNYEVFKEDPSYYWEVERKVMPSFENAKPNKAHKALKKLEKVLKKKGRGEISAILTQNIDKLHQKAGSKAPIIELHGNAYDITCLDCGADVNRKHVNNVLEETQEIPTCPECGGKIKPNTTLFKEPIDQEKLTKAREHAKNCDVMLILGTSLEVFPANELPMLARMNKAKLICMNNDRTAKDKYFRVKIIADLTESLPTIVRLIKKMG